MTISATVIADSISPAGTRITTYELIYPRFIHSEFMTHRVFSRNAASSRAIPVKRAIELIREDTAMPIHWGKNQPGMSAKEECYAPIILRTNVREVEPPAREFTREEAWNIARDNAIIMAEAFDKAGYHKQIVNRLLECFTHIKVVLTTTEDDNFFWLRRHTDAQPEIHQLADVAWEARCASTPVPLKPGDWHVPYYNNGQWSPSGYVRMPMFEDLDGKRELDCTLEEAIAISSSCCAQVSYRRLDDSLDKALKVYERLVDSKPVHASPFEHQASPMPHPTTETIEPWAGLFQDEGITHLAKTGDYWSGNFKGWIQHRQLIKDNVCNDYNPGDESAG